jgi:DNA helicase-2/ATP-dependent DNA helicase PcrA
MPNEAAKITVAQLIGSLEARNGYPLNQDQRDAVLHSEGPLWIIAGPGTGKTEVLVARCLRLLCCNGVNPKSILITTFTEKAALNLRQRIDEHLIHLQKAYPLLREIDGSGLRVDTLHSLCNDILQEYRYEPYRNLRLLDDVESHMLIRGRIASYVRDHCQLMVANFNFLFGNKPQLSLWDITKGTMTLLNRIVEDDLDTLALAGQGESGRQAVMVNDQYEQILREKHACDFARLQKHFLEFLRTPLGQSFLHGDELATKPPLLHVLVDEYQDTNPIQEEIYFALVPRTPHNITVVGDDDQALYRFRGGSVDSMVGFGDACQLQWKVRPMGAQLRENYRSHHSIVNWCEGYISGFPIMQKPYARAAGKLGLIAASGRTQNYPAVGFIKAPRVSDLASAFAQTVNGLLDNRVIEDLSQCVLLLASTKEGAQGAGPFVDALRHRRIPYYNPRSKSFVEQREVRALLGALISVLDPGATVGTTLLGRDLTQLVTDCLDEFNAAATQSSDLRQYLVSSHREIQRKQFDEEITPAVPTIVYRILSMEPFASFQRDVEQDLRLSKVTRLIESFCAQYGRRLKMDKNWPGQVNNWWLTQFYYVFCGYLSTFGVDDDEDDEVISPPGRVPIMTIHQSKGLEFDFVFVGTLGRSVAVDAAIRLQDLCRPYRRKPPVFAHSTQDLAWHDDVRAHYVAYSRAKHALVLLATNSQLAKNATASFGVGGGTEFSRRYAKL